MGVIKRVGLRGKKEGPQGATTYSNEQRATARFFFLNVWIFVVCGNTIENKHHTKWACYLYRIGGEGISIEVWYSFSVSSRLRLVETDHVHLDIREMALGSSCHEPDCAIALRGSARRTHDC